MFPTTEIPLGRGLGAVLLLAAAVLAAWNPALGPRYRGRTAAILPAALGLLLLVTGTLHTFAWPTYGLMMLLGTLTGSLLCWRWARQRGIKTEVVVEFALLGFVCGIAGARVVYLAEQWDAVFAAQPPAIASPGLAEPLAAGDVLRLRTHRGEARVGFTADERDLEAVAARIAQEVGSAAGLRPELLVVRHRGDDGLVSTVRGLVLETADRGPSARLEVLASPAATKLQLPVGQPVTGQPAPPWWAVFDLRLGGLTYFGAVIGILVAFVGWSWYRGLRLGTVGDIVAPLFPWGTAFGRVGCLARGCCWGREAGEGALIAVSYPPWSPPWNQMAGERLSCAWDPVLAEGALSPPLREALGDLARGTPPLHATQLYEALGVIAIFTLLLAFRRFLQRREGQAFALVVLLMCPLRWADEHLRRDHDYFFDLLPGYPLTVTQVAAGLLFLVGVGLMIVTSVRGRPLEPEDRRV